MIGEELLARKPIPLSKVKNLLEKRKREGELTYEQENALKYAKMFSKIKKKVRDQMLNELMQLETINEELAVKIVDIMPADLEIMKILPEKKGSVREEDLEKAFEIVQKYMSEADAGEKE